MDWWLWLSLTGTALGLTISVKWIGFFVVALIGCFTIEELWGLLCNPSVGLVRALWCGTDVLFAKPC